jgi:hypothetical protein
MRRRAQQHVVVRHHLRSDRHEPARRARSADRYDLAPENYLIIPQERWMINTFAHYDIADGVTGYLEGTTAATK